MLDLRGLGTKGLPASIGKLKHLRYLDLRGCYRIRELPRSFYKLQSLIFLKMSGVHQMQLPDSMQSLISLRCLEISIKGSHLKEIRPGCWSSLQYLGLFNCLQLKCLFVGMQYLTSLRTLHLNSCDAIESLPRSLKFLTKLEHLAMHYCKNFNLIMEPEEEEEQHLRLSLKTFSIMGLPASRDLPRLLLEGSSSTLLWIKIVECNNFEVLPEWLQNLTSLQKLEVVGCPKLSSLPEGMNRLSALTQLKISACPTLKKYADEIGVQIGPKLGTPKMLR